MPPTCRRCPYFQKEDKRLRKGTIIIGLCKLRQMYVSDETINNELCKDRAVISISKEEEDRKDPLGLGISF